MLRARFGDGPYLEWFSVSASFAGLAESSAMIENVLATQVRILELGVPADNDGRPKNCRIA